VKGEPLRGLGTDAGQSGELPAELVDRAHRG
jgi:hypothetical protein